MRQSAKFTLCALGKEGPRPTEAAARSSAGGVGIKESLTLKRLHFAAPQLTECTARHRRLGRAVGFAGFASTSEHEGRGELFG